MLVRLNTWLERWLGRALAILFAGLIAVVFLQVAARNVLELSLIWTLDVAQLLFAWCIFVGAALAFRKGAHYVVDLWPDRFADNRVINAFATAASIAVIGVLIYHGALMTRIGLNRLAPSLGISELWFFLPIPLGAVLMALFLAERLLTGRTPTHDPEAEPS